MQHPNPKLRVYYDGLCHLCSAEINHYKKIPGHENLEFVDISSIAFDPLQDGLNPFHVNKFLHVKDAQGRVFTKVDALIEICKILPKYHFLSKIAQTKIFRPIFDLIYWILSSIRPYLPKKPQLEKNGATCDLKKL